MILFDNISYEKQQSLRALLAKKKLKIKNISEISKDERLGSAICVFSVVQSFFDTDAFEFLRSQQAFKELNIILLVEKNSYGNLSSGSIAASWAHALVGPRRKDYKVLSEIDEADEEYIFTMITSQLAPSKKSKLSEVTIYTDGACSGNPGVGGWAAVLVSNSKIKEISGGEIETTNNRMELLAAIKALESLKKPCKVTLFSDSAYLVNAFNQGWLNQWKKSHWKNSDKVMVKNTDLWQRLDALTELHSVTFNKVKGHADDKFNNRCDELAVAETQKLKSNLED